MKIPPFCSERFGDRIGLSRLSLLYHLLPARINNLLHPYPDWVQRDVLMIGTDDATPALLSTTSASRHQLDNGSPISQRPFPGHATSRQQFLSEYEWYD